MVEPPKSVQEQMAEELARATDMLERMTHLLASQPLQKSIQEQMAEEIARATDMFERMTLQNSVQEQMVEEIGRATDMLERMTHLLASQPLQMTPKFSSDVEDGTDRVLDGAAAQIDQEAQDRRGSEAMGQGDCKSDTGARRKGLGIPAPRFSGRAEAFMSWRDSFLAYADYFAFAGCLTGQLKMDLSCIRTEGQAISAGFSPRNFEDSKIAQYALRTCCTDHVFQSICRRHSFIHEIWEELDEVYRPRTLARRKDLQRQFKSASLQPGEDPRYMLDRMTRISEELARLGTTVHPNVITRFLRQLPDEYSFEKQLLEGQEPDRDEVVRRVYARYHVLKGQTTGTAPVARGKPVRNDPAKIRCYSCQGLGHVRRVCPNRKSVRYESNKSVSDSSQQSNKPKGSDETTVYGTTALEDDLKSIEDSFLVLHQRSVLAKRSVVAKLGRGQAGDGKAGASRGMNADSCLDDVSESKALSCLMVKGTESHVGIDPEDHPSSLGIESRILVRHAI